MQHGARGLVVVVVVRAVLHKLKASCGFVGALRLARAVDALALQPSDALAFADFEDAAQDALLAGNPQS